MLKGTCLGIFCLALTVLPIHADPMTPVENGFTWIADICIDDPAGRTPAQCITAKCADLYGSGSAGFVECTTGAWVGIGAPAEEPGGPMTPGQNGYTWIADICVDDPAGRTAAQCITDKCADLYGSGTLEFIECIGGAVVGIEDMEAPATPAEPGTLAGPSATINP